MRAVSNAEGLVEVLMDQNAALGERDAERRGFDLKDKPLKADGVVSIDGAFGLDGEDPIQVQMSRQGDEGRALLFGFDGESFIKSWEKNILEETVGGVFGFDAVETQFIGEPSLQGFIHSFAASAGFRGVSGDGFGAELSQSAADLSEMAFLDFASCFWSEEEVGSPVRVERAEDAIGGDTVS